MTDTGGRHEGVAACPFVAFGSDRDRRASIPDERHRCYADDPPAPRAIGHQATFCLTPNFAGCPTFVDWAKRQAARAVPPASGSPAAVAAAAATDTDRLETALEQGPGPGSRDAAPPPWLSETPSGQLAFAPPEDAPAAQAGELIHEDDTHDLMDRATAGQRPGRDADDADAGRYERRGRLGEGAGAAAIAALSAAPGEEARPRSAAPGPPGARQPADDDVAPPAFLADRVRTRDPGPQGVTRFTDRPSPREAGPAEASQARRAEPPRGARGRRPDARRRRGMPAIPPVLLGLGALLIAAAILFILPTLFTNPPQIGLGPSGSPEPTVTVAPSPTVPPSPTPQQYTVQEGDTMSAIAAEFDLTLAELQAANPQIEDPDTLAIGDVLTIPVPGSGSPSPSAQASSPAP